MIKFRIALLIFAGLVALASGAGMAQGSGGAKGGLPTAMPNDPGKLMQLAANVNGITGPDLKPWHLKVSYKLLDENGKTTDEGTYEEFWAGQEKFKRTFAGGSFTQTDYGTDRGIYRSGSDKLIPFLIADIRRELVTPLPEADTAGHLTYALQPIDSNGVKVSCLRATSAPQSDVVYCLMLDRPIVVINTYTAGSFQAMHDRILGFHGRFIAGDLTLQRGPKVLLTAHVDELKTVSAEDVAFAPSADAVLVPRRISLSGEIVAPMLLKRTPPIYPPIAKSARVSGVVVIHAIIGADGHIAESQVISGPPMLQQAALDAVRTSVYQPYAVDAKSVEVDTTINVVFNLGG